MNTLRDVLGWVSSSPAAQFPCHTEISPSGSEPAKTKEITTALRETLHPTWCTGDVDAALPLTESTLAVSISQGDIGSVSVRADADNGFTISTAGSAKRIRLHGSACTAARDARSTGLVVETRCR